MTFFTRLTAFLGLIVVSALMICCFSCGDFMRNEDQYFDFTWETCQYMKKHKFPYVGAEASNESGSNKFETDYRCYCRYFEFMRPRTLTPVFVTLILFVTWSLCLAIAVGNKTTIVKKKKSISFEWSP